MIRENNSLTNKTIKYSYDTSGNITSQKTYAYTTGTLGTLNETITYSYGNENWKDQLTSYNGQVITYDEIGNPENYLGNTMTWNGRELLSITNEDDTISYSYDINSQRTSKTVGQVTTTYDYIGDQLVHEKRSNYDLYYRYDSNGNLYQITHIKNNVTTEYYVTTNTRGDVEAIYDASGNLQARYNYGSWGEMISVVDANGTAITSPTHIGLINPIRYRGYYYDSETGYYYLQTRYYDPVVHRFINSDGYVTTDLGAYSTNMYAYCENNPIKLYDDNGSIGALAAEFVARFAINMIVTAVSNFVTGQEFSVSDALLSGISAAVDTFNYKATAITATVTGAISFVSTLSEGGSVQDAFINGALAFGSTYFTFTGAIDAFTGDWATATIKAAVPRKDFTLMVFLDLIGGSGIEYGKSAIAEGVDRNLKEMNRKHDLFPNVKKNETKKPVNKKERIYLGGGGCR